LWGGVGGGGGVHNIQIGELDPVPLRFWCPGRYPNRAHEFVVYLEDMYN
jgi:hypothetical protein